MHEAGPVRGAPTEAPDASRPSVVGAAAQAHLPSAAVLLGFDFGMRRIGVAVGNTLTASARPLRTIAAEPVAGRFAEIGALIEQWQPALLVVGRPLHADGAPNDTTPRCERFARQLSGRFGLRVEFVDERYSSVAGEHDRPDDDAAAAATILGQYLREPGRR